MVVPMTVSGSLPSPLAPFAAPAADTPLAASLPPPQADIKAATEPAKRGRRKDEWRWKDMGGRQERKCRSAAESEPRL
jgi:hypothetical protein